MAEHGVLEIELVETASDDQAEQPAQKPVADRPEHPVSLTVGGGLANCQVGEPIEFLYPTGDVGRCIAVGCTRYDSAP